MLTTIKTVVNSKLLPPLQCCTTLLCAKICITKLRDCNINTEREDRVMRREVLFRSGRLDDATTKDLELLIKTFDIKAVIDLRAETEGSVSHIESIFINLNFLLNYIIS